MSELLKKQIMRTMQAGKPSLFGQAWLLLLHILLGLQHVWAFLFLPSARSFEHVHELTQAGYTASYLDHCRMQHNIRFGTLAYSMVLACGIAFVTATVEIINPQQFGHPAYAASLTVNSSADDDDGSCDVAPGDCTLREAINAASNGDTINFTGAMTITLNQSLNINKAITIDGFGVDSNSTRLVCADSSVNPGVRLGTSFATINRVSVLSCIAGIQVMPSLTNVTIQDSTIKGGTGFGIQVLENASVNVSNNTFVDNTGIALDFNNSTTNSVTGNTFSGNPTSVNATNPTSLVINDNTFTGSNARFGVVIDGGSLVSFSGNTFTGITRIDSYALEIVGSPSSVTVGLDANDLGTANIFSGNSGAIHITGNTHLIKGNTFSDTTVTDVYAETLSGSFIEYNTFSGGVYGVSLVDSDENFITANTLSDYTGGIGIHLNTDSDGNTVNDNTLTDVDGDNILLNNGSDDNTVEINTISKSVSDSDVQIGVHMDGSSSNIIAGNVISGLNGPGVILNNDSDDNIVGYSLDNIGNGNTLSGNLYAVELQGTEQTGNIIRRNTMVNDSSDLIVLTNSASDATPANSDFTTHNASKISGVTVAGALVDLYYSLPDSNTVTYLASKIADVNGVWSYQADLTSYGRLYTTISTASGTGIFNSRVQPGVDVIVTDFSVSDITATTATLTWTTNINTNSSIQYAKTGGSETIVTTDDATKTHAYTLTGLNAATDYTVSIAAADVDDDLNTGLSSEKSFTTQAASFGSVTLEQYATNLANTTTVTSIGGDVEVDATSTPAELFPLGDLTFTFTDKKSRLDDYRLHFVLKVVQGKNIVNQKKAFNQAGKASFQVKQQLLALEKTYAVYSGVIKNGVYLNGDGLAKRFTFTLIDAPQLLSPSTPVYYRMPEEFVVASKAPSVTVYVDEQFHCVATMTDGVGSCQPPFGLALGSYTVRLVDARGGTLSLPLLISDFAAGNVLTTDVRSANFYKRLIYNGQPTLVGVVPTGHTVEVHIPQVDGAMLAEVKASTGAITTWQYKLKIATLPVGATDATIIYRNPAGVITEQTTYRIMRTYRAVAPAVIDPANNTSATTAPTIQVIGPNDHTLELLDSAGTRLGFTSYTNGGKAVALSSWYTDVGTYTVTLRNRNRLNVPSLPTTFTFTITAPVTATATIVTDVDTNTNTTTNTGTDTSNTNTNTTDTTNDNTNTSADTNTTNTNSTTTNTNTTVKIIDTDKDGLADIEEPDYGTDLNNPDTDGDTLYDGDEVAFGSDPLTSDGDEDGLTDPQEYTMQTNPKLSDTDTDSVLDGAEVVAQTNPTDFDSDDDELSDNEGDEYGTDATDADSDDDRLLDGDDLSRGCDPLQADSDADGIDDLTEALAGTDCSATDNLWSNLTGVEALLQEQAIALYNSTGTETVSYPLLTSAQVTAEDGLAEQLTTQITTATSLDIIPGAQTVVSDGTVKVVTRTTEISITNWIAGLNPNTTDDTYVLVKGSVILSDSLKNQPAYVLVTFFSTPIVKIAQVDPNGQWTMSVPAELLTTGEHTAFAAVEVNGTRSEQVEVAKFVIENKRTLSNTSWLIIINVVVAIVALLAAWFVHLRRQSASPLS